MIYLKQVAPAIEFFKNAFDAIVLRQWNNDNGSVHVAEMSTNGALFHMHEESTRNNELSRMMTKAVAAGGTEIDPVQDYDYDYRQGTIGDPFGHHWVVQKKIGN